MSYIIYNGIRSDDLKVIIAALPPIVKPPERYDTIRVDGSSKVTYNFLGYDVFEKSIQLGLKDADLGPVIDWLRGSGQLILSNEPDKYYDAYIPEQIDYEKALRFRKAKVTFLCQPYKHATGEDITESRLLINQGNVKCLPLMTIYGSGTVNLLINGARACTITIDGYITLDGEEQEARKGAVLQNRLMIGDFPELSPGLNEITFTGSGTVTRTETLVRSRWL